MKLALVGPDAFTAWQFRRGLIKCLINQGCEVHVFCAPDDYVVNLKKMGVRYHEIKYSRFINPIQDIVYLYRLWSIFRVEKFELVHNNTIKPNIYGAIAAKAAGVSQVIAMVEGFGFSFSGKNTPMSLIYAIARILYTIGFSFSSKVWFVNADDAATSVKLGMINKQKVYVIRSGGGIDLTEYAKNTIDTEQLNKLQSEIIYDSSHIYISMVVARIVWSKGVKEYIEAARLLHKKFPIAKFLLIGPLTPDSPEAVPASYMQTLPTNVKWLSFRKDIKEIFHLSDIVVLPSYYGEGLPYVLLEGMAMGKAIVTTDNVGCREVIDEGKNGFLVPTRDSHALANAIELLLFDPEKRKQFGIHSRHKMEKEFDEKVILQEVLTKLYELHLIEPSR